MASSSAPVRQPPVPSPQRSLVEPAPPSPSIGKMLGVVAVALGVGVLGYYAFDGHAHTCESCGHRWRHLGAFNLGDPRAHSCGRCGTVQWWKDGTPHVFRQALRSPPPEVLPGVIGSPLGRFREVPRLAASPTPVLPWPREVSK